MFSPVTRTALRLCALAFGLLVMSLILGPDRSGAAALAFHPVSITVERPVAQIVARIATADRPMVVGSGALSLQA